MKNIAKVKRIGICINSTISNMGDLQTCAIADMDLCIAVVALADVEAVKVVGDVVGGPGIHVPGWVGDGSVVGGRGSVHGVLLTRVSIIEAATAAGSDMPGLATDLAGGTVVLMSSVVTSAIAVVATTIAAALAASATMTPTATVATTVAASTRGVAVATLATMGVAGVAVATTSASEVDHGGAATKPVLGLVKIMTMLVGEKVGVHLVKGDVLHPDREGGDEAVVVVAEPGEDVRDDLVIAQWLADGGQRVR